MKYLQIKKLNKKLIQKKFLIALKNSMSLYNKEKQYNNQLRKLKGKNIYLTRKIHHETKII